jgi:hypothetical protein
MLVGEGVGVVGTQLLLHTPKQTGHECHYAIKSYWHNLELLQKK